MCPFNNERFVQVTTERDYLPRVPRPFGYEPDPDAHSDPGAHAPAHAQGTFHCFALARRADGNDARGMRNMAVGIGNWLASVEKPPDEAVVVLRDALEDEDTLVREHAVWALERLR